MCSSFRYRKSKIPLAWFQNCLNNVHISLNNLISLHKWTVSGSFVGRYIFLIFMLMMLIALWCLDRCSARSAQFTWCVKCHTFFVIVVVCVIKTPPGINQVICSRVNESQLVWRWRHCEIITHQSVDLFAVFAFTDSHFIWLRERILIWSYRIRPAHVFTTDAQLWPYLYQQMHAYLDRWNRSEPPLK